MYQGKPDIRYHMRANCTVNGLWVIFYTRSTQLWFNIERYEDTVTLSKQQQVPLFLDPIYFTVCFVWGLTLLSSKDAVEGFRDMAAAHRQILQQKGGKGKGADGGELIWL